MNGEELKQWRKVRGLTQLKMAHLLPVNIDTLQNLEQGRSKKIPPYLPRALRDLERELSEAE
jgi:transcriptional regulator with XRE-family HTH domain